MSLQDCNFEQRLLLDIHSMEGDPEELWDDSPFLRSSQHELHDHIESQHIQFGHSSFLYTSLTPHCLLRSEVCFPRLSDRLLAVPKSQDIRLQAPKTSVEMNRLPKGVGAVETVGSSLNKLALRRTAEDHKELERPKFLRPRMNEKELPVQELEKHRQTSFQDVHPTHQLDVVPLRLCDAHSVRSGLG